jgi:choline-sulfatase/glucosamine-6-phosphate deaminase
LTIRRYERDILDGKLGITYDDWKAIFKSAVRHAKQVCPKLRYIEVCNEYGCRGFIGCTPEEYYRFYRLGYQAVNEVNAEMDLEGDDRLLVGGPAVTGGIERKLCGFLREYHGDGASEKRLDFVSWHEYNKPYWQTAHRQQQVCNMLATYDLPCDLPLFVTEHDPYHPPAGSPEYNLINAAGLVKSLYFASRFSPEVKIFPWVQYHVAEIQTRFMWFDGPNEPDTRAEELRMLPAGCSMKLLASHKRWEIAVENGLPRNDLVLASVQNDALAVHAVNYGAPREVRVRIGNLPKVFTELEDGATLRVVKYLIDETHSNAVANPDYPGGLEKVAELEAALDDGAIELTHGSLAQNGILFWEVLPPRTGTPLPEPEFAADANDESAARAAPASDHPPLNAAEAFDNAAATADASVARAGQAWDVRVSPSQGRPGIVFEPNEGAWSLAEVDAIEVQVKNSGDRLLPVHLVLDNPGADRGSRRGCCIVSERIPQGETKTIRMPIGDRLASFLENPCRGVKEGAGRAAPNVMGRLDVNNVVRISVYVYQPKAKYAYEVSRLRVLKQSEPDDEASRRPNILYICTDQQFAEAMSCAGNPHVKTPAVDGLAERGMRFAEAYCTSPVCSPSRGSMFTGLYPHEHGVTVNNRPIKGELREIYIANVLRERGYECAYAGKWHLPGSAMRPSDQQRHPYRVLCGVSDSRVSDACAEYFEESRRRPFFLVASYLNPHDICLWAVGRESGYQEEPRFDTPLEQCPPLPENFAVAADEPSVLRDYYMTRHDEQKSFDEAKWRRYLHAYYAMVEAVDADIGRLLEALRARGLHRDTLVIFSSDHGDGLAAHQWLGKCCHYEEAMRVPFIVSYQGTIRPGRVDRTHFVSGGPDFYATALDYAGAAIPEGCQGRSLRCLLEGTTCETPWRDQVVSEIWLPGNSPKRGEAWKSAWGRMLRTQRFKYAVYDRGEFREQLHDLLSDPGEMQNLAGDPEYSEVLDEHRRRLADWCKRTGDAEFLPHLVLP